MEISDKILDFYRDNDHLLCSSGITKARKGPGLRWRSTENPFEGRVDNGYFMNSNNGLGDTLSVFHLPKFFKKHNLKSYIGAWPGNKYFNSLKHFNPDFEEGIWNHAPTVGFRDWGEPDPQYIKDDIRFEYTISDISSVMSKTFRP